MQAFTMLIIQPNRKSRCSGAFLKRRQQLQQHSLSLNLSVRDGNNAYNEDLNGRGEMRFGKMYQNQGKLEDSLSNLFRTSAPLKKSYEDDEYNNYEKNLQQMKQIQNEISNKSGNSEPQVMFPEKDANLDDVYLDADTYAAFSKSMPYVSTSTSTSSSPSSLSSSLSSSSPLSSSLPANERGEGTIAFVGTGKDTSIANPIMSKNPSLISNNEDNVDMKHMNAEELHRRVFENESGYLKQSKDFKKNLFSNQQKQRENKMENPILNSESGNNGYNDDKNDNDPNDDDEMSVNYFANRRPSRYIQRQKEAMELIDKEMKEMDEIIQKKKNSSSPALQNNNITNVNDKNIDAETETNDKTTNNINIKGGGEKGKCKKCGCELTSEEMEHSQTCQICYAERFEFVSGKSINQSINQSMKICIVIVFFYFFTKLHECYFLCMKFTTNFRHCCYKR